MRLALALLLSALALPASAWEQTIEWRFTGDEIVRFAVTEPQFDEDPEVLEVTLDSQRTGPTVITIESDLGMGDCPEILRYAQGNPGVTIVLTANVNAMTINGVTLAQCSER